MASWKKVVVESSAATIAQNTTGNAATATTAAEASTLVTSRNFSITGDVTANAVGFDGSAAVVLNTSLGADTVGNTQLDLVDGNSASDGYILSYVASGTGGDLQWIANTAAANNATITLTAGAGLANIGDGSFTLNQSGNEEFTIAVDGVLEDLDTLGAVDAANKFIVSSAAGTFAYQTAAQVKATLDLEIGTDVQAYDAELTTIAGLSSADGNFIVGSASGWTVESAGTARTSLGLGSNDSPTFAGLTVNGTVTTIDSTNVTIKDQFILLADADTAADVDGGIVVVGSTDTVAFGWDDDAGRWAIQNTGATSNMTSLTPFGYMSVVTSANGNSGSAPAGSAKLGNMYINTTSNSEELYIYF